MPSGGRITEAVQRLFDEQRFADFRCLCFLSILPHAPRANTSGSACLALRQFVFSGVVTLPVAGADRRPSTSSEEFARLEALRVMKTLSTRVVSWFYML